MFTDFDFFAYIVVPLLIIAARIADQTLGTLRLVYLSKGFKHIAPILGFFEVLIWITAVSQILRELNNFYYYVMYALGFALGNYIGLLIEEKISIGKILIRVFLKEQVKEITNNLIEKGFGITILDAEGSRGPVKVVFSIISRKKIHLFLSVIKKYDEHIFYTIEDIRSSAEGVFPVAERKRRRISGVIKFK
jgi:uncharacterized protein YebE (UPF0316 family)